MKNFLAYRYLVFFWKVPEARMPILKNLFFNFLWLVTVFVLWPPSIILACVAWVIETTADVWYETSYFVVNCFEELARNQVVELHQKIPPEELCARAGLELRGKETFE